MREWPGIREARNARDGRVRSAVEEYLFGCQQARPACIQFHLQRLRRHEPPGPHDQFGTARLVVLQVRCDLRSTISRLRWRTFAMSVATVPVIVPNCAACRARCATRAPQTTFLLGMQAMLGQEPPTYRRSTTAVRRPDRAMCHASSLPPWPLPRISTSSRSGSGIAFSMSRICCSVGWLGPRPAGRRHYATRAA
jgi:hypothetical protein